MASDEEYNARTTKKPGRRAKRRRVDYDSSTPSLGSSLEVLPQKPWLEPDLAYEGVIEPLLPSFEIARDVILTQAGEHGVNGEVVRPLTRVEESTLPKQIAPNATPLQRLVARKLQARRNMRLIPQANLLPLPTEPTVPPVHEEVVDMLYSIQTTPFARSFFSRIFSQYRLPTHAIAVDWETESDWMNLMRDIHFHHRILHPERDQAVETAAPIIYTTLQRNHLGQIHDLLKNIFWEGIDVTDSLDYSPERSTIVAVYKNLVVGVAIMTSPVETYITYLAVRSGWENSHIATSMLYHLCQHNPHRDVTLHVSTTNPAMTLYNRFGFKAEGFVSGFYEKYLEAPSRGSRNAFQLRLRR